jgi:hypothetical protein
MYSIEVEGGESSNIAANWRSRNNDSVDARLYETARTRRITRKPITGVNAGG